MGDAVTYKYLYFSDFTFRIFLEASSVVENCAVKVYLDDREEEILARVVLKRTNGKFDFQTVSADFPGEKINGIHSLHLKLEGGEDAVVCLKTIWFAVKERD